jgi:hypothetical protein
MSNIDLFINPIEEELNDWVGAIKKQVLSTLFAV